MNVQAGREEGVTGLEFQPNQPGAEPQISLSRVAQMPTRGQRANRAGGATVIIDA
jgi:hypothetical protein